MRPYNLYNLYNPYNPSYSSGGFQGAGNSGQNYGASTWAAPINIVQRPQIITYGASPFILTSDGVHGNITGYRSSYPAPTLTTSTSLFYHNFPQTVSNAQPALPYIQQPTYPQPANHVQQSATVPYPIVPSLNSDSNWKIVSKNSNETFFCWNEDPRNLVGFQNSLVYRPYISAQPLLLPPPLSQPLNSIMVIRPDNFEQFEKLVKTLREEQIAKSELETKKRADLLDSVDKIISSSGESSSKVYRLVSKNFGHEINSRIKQKESPSTSLQPPPPPL